MITFTTDFGLKDHYVGAMKGAALSVNPGATIVDISHLVGPQNVLEGLVTLNGSTPYFPAGTVHVGVVDPGVGTGRRCIIVESREHFFVGPDNGLFTKAIDDPALKRVVHITNDELFRKPVSNTFHGRDIFSPVAAHLSLGKDPALFGPEIEDAVTIDIPTPVFNDDCAEGIVLFSDGFGNLITNIPMTELNYLSKKGTLVTTIRGKRIVGILKTYGEARSGDVVATEASSGHLEIAIREASAASAIGAGPGEPVSVGLK